MPRCSRSKHISLGRVSEVGKVAEAAKGTGSGEASNKSHDGSQERGEQAVSEPSQEGAEGSDQAGDDSNHEAGDENDDLSQQGEDGVKQRRQLRSEAKDDNERVDGLEDNSEEGNSEVENVVNVTVSNGETRSASELGDDLGEIELGVAELLSGLLLAFLLGDVSVLDLLADAVWEVLATGQQKQCEVKKRTENIGLASDTLDEAGQEANKVSRVGQLLALGGSSLADLIGNLADTELAGEEIVESGDGVANVASSRLLSTRVTLSNAGGGRVKRSGKGRSDQGSDREESSLHCECL